MMQCGLLGRKLGHSYSPQIHSQLGDYPYRLFETEPEELEHFLRQGNFTGLNVTIPYKKAVIPYLDELSDVAKKLGAVNTVVRREDRLIGHNTDYFGFQTMVESANIPLSGKKCLVLGSGGASNTAVAVLRELGAQPIVISRSGENNYRNLELHADAALIVNCTPVGMYPNTEATPLELDSFPKLEAVLDVIYNPARTGLLMDAERRGIPAVNGLLMLAAQAWESAQWFTGASLPRDKIPQIHRILRQQMENIVLIGMPGCGKTTIGKLLAEAGGRTFIDSDEEIVRRAGKSIPRIFAEDGEVIFRQLETQVLADLGKQSGLVIATGGGCVTQPRNYPLLHRNGRIIWIRRDTSLLPIEGRPLSQAADLRKMYARREPMYRQFADLIIDNDTTVEDAAGKIMEERL